MTEPKTCPDCGGSLPPDALDGACPRCLLAAGLERDDEGDGAASPRPRRPDPPSLEEIAAHFPALAVEELIGAGGMGIVYRARQSALDRMVALKVLWPQLAQDRAFADRFTREARAMARLDHPNIVRVFEFGERDGLFFLVMEHVDGKSLRELMDAGGIHPEEALAIVPQICAALQYAHDQGVVHRDIKPANVLVDTTGRVRIVDFGLAKLVEGEDVALTRAGQVMGTLQYMAPEQYRTPDHVDHRADIYSLGVVFYEMLTGDVPVGRFEAPSERVQVDVRLDQVVLRSLEREPERRYQKAADVGTAVTSISAGKAPPPAPAPAEPVVDTARGTRGRMSKLAVAATLLVLLQGALALVSLAVPPVIVLSLLAAVTALGLGLIALFRVLGSSGRLRGAGFALTALIAPWFVACGGFLLLGTVAARHGVETMGPIRIEGETVRFGEFTIDEDGVRIGDWVHIDDDGVRVREPIEIDDRGIRRVPLEPAPEPFRAPLLEGLPEVVISGGPGALTREDRCERARDLANMWIDLQSRTRDNPDHDLENALPFYSSADRRRLRGMSREELESARDRAELGAPLLRDELVRSLHEYRLAGVWFDRDGLSALMMVVGPENVADKHVLRIPMATEGGSWRFSVGVIEGGAVPVPLFRTDER